MTLTITCTTATGATVELNDVASGCRVLKGAAGLDAPPVFNNIGQYLSSDGGVLVKMRRQVRPIILPLFLTDATRVQTKVASIAAALVGPSTITISDGTITRSLLNVIYEAGLEGVRSNEMAGGETWRKFAVSLLALDPWWYGASTSTALTFAAAVAFDAAIAFDAVVGFSGSDANPVTIVGDAPASPITTIVGPFTTLQVGIAGGETFTLSSALAAGETIIVDTTPGNRGPRLNAGAIDWSLLTPSSRLWELPLGSSVLNSGSTGSTGASSVQVEWRERWLTP
jgi:hypothetical protein